MTEEKNHYPNVSCSREIYAPSGENVEGTGNKCVVCKGLGFPIERAEC